MPRLKRRRTRPADPMNFDDPLFTGAEFCCTDRGVLTEVRNQRKYNSCGYFPPLDSMSAGHAFQLRNESVELKSAGCTLEITDNAIGRISVKRGSILNGNGFRRWLLRANIKLMKKHAKELLHNRPVLLGPQSVIDGGEHYNQEQDGDDLNRHTIDRYGVSTICPEEMFDHAMKFGIYQEKSYPYGGGRKTPRNLRGWRLKATSKAYISEKDSEEARDCIRGQPLVALLTCDDGVFSMKGDRARDVYMPKKKPKNHEIRRHHVLAIGFGTEGHNPYHIIKNSWGETIYGLRGYGRVASDSLSHFCAPVGPFYWVRGRRRV